MTFNTEIEKTEKEIAVLQKKLELLKEIETHKSQPRMNLENKGEFSIVSFNDNIFYRLQFPDGFCIWLKTEDDHNYYKVNLEFVDDIRSKHQLESVWKNEVFIQKNTEPYCPDDPPEYDEIEWDEKDNPNLQKVIDEMVEERKSQTLYEIIRGWYEDRDCPTCEELLNRIEKWLPKEQSSKGSQNAYVECSVEGFNDCLTKIKRMLR